MTERLFLRLEGDASHGPESTAPPGTLYAGAIPESLRRHVAQVMVYREQFPDDGEVTERIIPDGVVRLVFNLGEAPATGEHAGHRISAIGASATPTVIRLRGRNEGVSVALRPGAALAILGIPASELTDASVHLDDLWSGEASRLLERLAEAGDDDARIALLQTELLARVQRAVDPSAAASAMRAARLISTSGGILSVGEVAAQIGVGERRLQQLFKTHVGLSPRAWSRLARLQSCLRLLRDHPSSGWAETALEAGYYDQAHLANEFRALCGLTPTAFLERAASASGSSKTTH